MLYVTKELEVYINKLENALEFYANTDYWSEPKGGGARNIFMDFESISFNGFDAAQKVLEEIHKFKKKESE